MRLIRANARADAKTVITEDRLRKFSLKLSEYNDVTPRELPCFSLFTEILNKVEQRYYSLSPSPPFLLLLPFYFYVSPFLFSYVRVKRR